jgi:N-sulfoglucosamine sulfohydrolase
MELAMKSFHTTKTRRAPFCLFVFLFWLACSVEGAPRNVVLIVSDDQGIELEAYGNGSVRTPHIDALAKDGTLFTQAFATVSSCSPSRAVILTGLYSHTNGMYGLAHDVHNQHLLPSVPTLPQTLRQSGYVTGLIGKKHILPVESLPFDAELAPEQPGNRDVASMIEEARRFIESNDERPFFLLIGFSDPHRAAENFGNTRVWPSVPRVTYEPEKIELPAYVPDAPQARQDVAHYYESVSRLDSGIGLLMDALRATEHMDDTLIVYLSDNGAPFPGAKTTLYDPGIHLPLIIRAPDEPKRGVTNSAMVSWVDIAPTILEWTGVKNATNLALPGRSLIPLLGIEHQHGWDVIFASHGFHEIHQYYPMRAVRTREFKYILNLASELTYPVAGDIASSPTWEVLKEQPTLGIGPRTMKAFLNRPAEELYKLTTDPHEVINLALDPKYGEVLERMRHQLQQHRVATKDPWLPGQSSVFGEH